MRLGCHLGLGLKSLVPIHNRFIQLVIIIYLRTQAVTGNTNQINKCSTGHKGQVALIALITALKTKKNTRSK